MNSPSWYVYLSLIRDHTGEIPMPWPQNPTLSEQVARLEYDLKEAKTKISNQSRTICEQQSTIWDYSQDLMSLQTRIKDQAEQLNSIVGVSIVACQRRIKELEADCDQPSRILDSLEGIIDHQAEELTKVRGQLARCNETTTKALKDYREQIARAFEVPMTWDNVSLYQSATYAQAAAAKVRAVPLPGNEPLSKTRTDWYFPEMLQKLSPVCRPSEVNIARGILIHQAVEDWLKSG